MAAFVVWSAAASSRSASRPGEGTAAARSSCAAKTGASRASATTASGSPPAAGLLARAAIGHDQGLDQRIEIARHHPVQIVEREADAVVGHAVLRKVVGADLL